MSLFLEFKRDILRGIAVSVQIELLILLPWTMRFGIHNILLWRLIGRWLTGGLLWCSRWGSVGRERIQVLSGFYSVVLYGVLLSSEFDVECGAIYDRHEKRGSGNIIE